MTGFYVAMSMLYLILGRLAYLSIMEDK